MGSETWIQGLTLMQKALYPVGCVVLVKALQYQMKVADGYSEAESKGFFFCIEVRTLDDGAAILVDTKKLAAILKLKKKI